MKRSISIFTAASMFTISVLLSGCVTETLTIKPDSKRFYLPLHKSGYATMPESPIGIPCPGGCVATMGTSCSVQLPGDDSTIVGYSHNYDPGTQPCRCWEYANCAYRGYVGFDLAALKGKGIVAANLKWHSSTQKSIGDSASNAGTCLKTVYIALEPWQTNALTQGEKLNFDSPDGDINVSSTVRDWMSGARPNYGFFFVGPDENLDVKNNDTCLTILENLRLEVVVSVNK